MSQDFYARIAKWYDLEFADFDADIQLYAGYAGIVGSPVLELGCGTGRLVLALARLGHEVTGVDSSPSMLDIAREHLAMAQLDGVELHLGDVQHMPNLPSGQFRLVIFAINTFLHLPSRTEQLRALSEVRRVLHHDGLLIVDVFHPTPHVLHSMDERQAIDASWLLDDSSRLDRWTQRRLHTATQRIETTHYYDLSGLDGLVRRTVASYDMRYVHRFEMEGLLDQADFAIEGLYGGYALDPFDDHSPTMIFVAHRR